MTDAAIAPGRAPADKPKSGIDLDRKIHPGGVIAFGLLIAAGLAFAGFNIFSDTQHVGETLAFAPFLFLGLALLIALGCSSP